MSLRVFVSGFEFCFFFQRLYHLKEAHSIFVTGLEFAPQEDTTRLVTGGFEFSLLSISADNQVKIHQQSPQSKSHEIFNEVNLYVCHEIH